VPEIPFAKVNSVVAHSPAEEAGLKAGDMIRRFGNVNWMNHEKLSKVAETVQRHEGVSGTPILV
jgi:26S proteasome non-ATPase regulatory subunit 9